MISIFKLMRVYQTFFVRKILNSGVMNNLLFRFYLGVMVMVMYIFLTIALIQYINIVPQTKEDSLLFVNLYGIQSTFVTCIVFCLIRWVFMNAKDFGEITAMLPVMRYKRQIAFRYYEMLLGFCCLLFCLLVAITVLFIRFPLVRTEIFFGIVLMSVFVYITLYVSYYVLVFMFQRVKLLAAAADYLVYLICGMSLFVLSGMTKNIGIELLDAHIQKQPMINPYTILLVVREQIGGLPTLMSVIVLLGMMIVLLRWIPMSVMKIQHPQGLHMRLKKVKLFSAYILAFVRDPLFGKNVLSLLVMFIVIFSLITQNWQSIFVFTLISFQSVYHFENTQSIRYLYRQYRYKASKDFFMLVCSQLIVTLPFVLVPAIGLYGMGRMELHNIVWVVVGLSSMQLSLTTMGILFPAHSSNPFSPLLSLGMLFVLCCFVVMMMIIFQPSMGTIQVSAMIGLGLFVWYGILGLDKSKEVDRYEIRQ